MNPISVFFILYVLMLVILWILTGTFITASKGLKFKHILEFLVVRYDKWRSFQGTFYIIPSISIDFRKHLSDSFVSFNFRWLFFHFGFGFESEEA